MSRCVRKFGIDGIMLVVLSILLLGVASLAGSITAPPGTAPYQVHVRPDKPT